ncbi:MAG TPA: glycosyltransferase [Acidobacteriota bacterium]|nr:glycosyltransferase [Acidobacteriota bacterium]
MDIIIIGRKNNFGLSKDSELLAGAIRREGFAGNIREASPRDRGVPDRLMRRRCADIAIHLERFFPAWRSAALKHILVPNQERFPRRHLGRLKKVDLVLAKSNCAAGLFRQHGVATEYLGFTSDDRFNPSCDKNWMEVLHLAGANTLKGTEDLLTLWRRHPEWPRLNIVQKKSLASKSAPSNVNMITEFVPDAGLRKLQNQSGIHLCPSRSEGWGHHIVEGMSTGALIVTVDAPPMNEHLDASTGLLVPYARSEPRHLGRCYFADLKKLESMIESALAMPVADKVRYGRAARRAYEQIDREFRRRIRRFFVPGRE